MTPTIEGFAAFVREQWKFSLFLFSLLLAGCGDPVTRITEKTLVGQTTQQRSCSKGPGYCMACGLNVSGSYDCYQKFKHNCPGKQKAEFNVYLVTREHESGELSQVREKRFVRELSECK